VRLRRTRHGTDDDGLRPCWAEAVVVGAHRGPVGSGLSVQANQMPISRAADSGESEPCTMFC